MVDEKKVLMHIDSYAFGKMTVNGQVYTKDLIVFPKKISPNWWRKEGHSLVLEDLKEVLAFKPEILIVGIGDSAIMKIPKATRQALQKKGIELMSGYTDQAVFLFNENVKDNQKIVGAFHLTC